MYQFSVATGLATTVLLFSAASAETRRDNGEVITIPLSEIWANNMPSTRDIGKLDPKRPLAYEIRRAIGFPPKDEEAKPGFAVMGTGLEALQEAHAVFVDKKKPRATFPAGSDVSVVFFTHETRPYVHLQKADRQGNKINVHWRFVPHETEDMTIHVALIPLGKIPSGKYRVNVIRSEMPKKYIDLGFRPTSDKVARRIVCRSFSFTVSEQGE
jgi:hypothetical protein